MFAFPRAMKAEGDVLGSLDLAKTKMTRTEPGTATDARAGGSDVAGADAPGGAAPPAPAARPDAAAGADAAGTAAPLAIGDPRAHPRALRVLFLSSDTGGGHRASATSLAQQFARLFPGSVHALCDIIELDGARPYNHLVRTYKHLSAHPQQWKIVYNVSNTRAYEMLADVHMKGVMELAVRKRIRGYEPDVVVSVHPLMTNVPVMACRNISAETGRHLPMFTVCTDLGSAHSMWFANGVEKLFVASEAIRKLALQRGKVPPEKIAMSGLPIRNDFAVQAEGMGDRHGPEGRAYRSNVRARLGLDDYGDRKTVLVMGGGEGCGQLSKIVDALYLQFVERGMAALILVVCGRNRALQDSLAQRDWAALRDEYLSARTSGVDFEACVGLLSDAGCFGADGGGVAGRLRRIISTPSLGLGHAGSPFRAAVHRGPDAEADAGDAATSLPNSRPESPTGPGAAPSSGTARDDDEGAVEAAAQSCAKRNDLYDLTSLLHPLDSSDEGGTGATTVEKPGEPAPEEAALEHNNSLVDAPVKVIGLGFVTNMADYMVVADVLVSKAGPGTIGEAASLSLPVLLTSFLPGQEEGNVDYVVEGRFGTFVSDADPQGISDVVAEWLLDEEKLRGLSARARDRGAPDAAAEIVRTIGESALRWKEINESKHSQDI